MASGEPLRVHLEEPEKSCVRVPDAGLGKNRSREFSAAAEHLFLQLVRFCRVVKFESARLDAERVGPPLRYGRTRTSTVYN